MLRDMVNNMFPPDYDYSQHDDDDRYGKDYMEEECPTQGWMWAWYTSAHLGFPLENDGYNRNIHPLLRRYIL